jgi:hypothetical protein
LQKEILKQGEKPMLSCFIRWFALIFAMTFFACMDPSPLKFDVVNNSNEKIFALYVAKAGNWEIYREAINAHDRERNDYGNTTNEEIWEAYIQFQGGWLIKLYSYDLYGHSKESLDSIAPLKSWEIQDWGDLEAHHAKLEYP